MAATAGLPTLLLPLMQVLVCCALAQSDLQLLRLTPSAVSMHLYQDPLSRNSQEETPEDQTTQFHAQDSSGRSLFGFSTPVQSRLEARDSDGAVRGSFSYRDPNGAHVKVQYWDEGNGFHVAANHLPVHYLAPVRDTPEVEAARRRHMEAYQQVLRRQLELLYHQQQQQAVDGDAVQAGDEGETGASDEGVRHPALPAQALYDPTQVHDALREAVVVEAPASRSSPADLTIYDRGETVKDLESRSLIKKRSSSGDKFRRGRVTIWDYIAERDPEEMSRRYPESYLIQQYVNDSRSGRHYSVDDSDSLQRAVESQFGLLLKNSARNPSSTYTVSSSSPYLTIPSADSINGNHGKILFDQNQQSHYDHGLVNQIANKKSRKQWSYDDITDANHRRNSPQSVPSLENWEDPSEYSDSFGNPSPLSFHVADNLHNYGSTAENRPTFAGRIRFQGPQATQGDEDINPTTERNGQHFNVHTGADGLHKSITDIPRIETLHREYPFQNSQGYTGDKRPVQSQQRDSIDFESTVPLLSDFSRRSNFTLLSSFVNTDGTETNRFPGISDRSGLERSFHGQSNVDESSMTTRLGHETFTHYIEPTADSLLRGVPQLGSKTEETSKPATVIRDNYERRVASQNDSEDQRKYPEVTVTSYRHPNRQLGEPSFDWYHGLQDGESNVASLNHRARGQIKGRFQQVTGNTFSGGVHRGVLERTNVGGFPPAAVGGSKEAAVLQQLVRGAGEAKALSSPPAGVSKEQLLLQPLSPARVTELPRAGAGGGFLYSFQYPHPVIPVTLRHGEQAAAAELPAAPSRRQQLSVSQRAALFGAVPVAAVHDAQVAPAQRSGDSSHQIKPVFLHHDQLQE